MKVKTQKTARPNITFGIRELDDKAEIKSTDLITVSAAPSAGKSSFALGVAKHISVKQKRPVIYFSLEFSKEQLVTRLLAAAANIEPSRFRKGIEDQKSWKRLEAASKSLSRCRIYVDDAPALLVSEIRGKARRLKSELGELGMIIIDYMQIMGVKRTSRAKSGNSASPLTEIAKSLKELAQEMDVPVMLLVMLYKKTGGRPFQGEEADLSIIINPKKADVAKFVVSRRDEAKKAVNLRWNRKYLEFKSTSAGNRRVGRGPNE